MRYSAHDGLPASNRNVSEKPLFRYGWLSAGLAAAITVAIAVSVGDVSSFRSGAEPLKIEKLPTVNSNISTYYKDPHGPWPGEIDRDDSQPVKVGQTEGVKGFDYIDI